MQPQYMLFKQHDSTKLLALLARMKHKEQMKQLTNGWMMRSNLGWPQSQHLTS